MVSTGTSKKHKRASTQRLNLRISRELKGTLVKAAKLQDATLSAFILDAARIAAEMALANRTRFVLSPSDWEKFNKALQAPARPNRALEKLLKERSILE